MTIHSGSVRLVEAIGNGIATRYYYTGIRIWKTTDLLVTVNAATLTLNVDYTVSLEGQYIDLADGALAPLDSLVQIKSNVPYTQEFDQNEGDKFPVQSIIQALDKLTILALQTREFPEKGDTGAKIISASIVEGNIVYKLDDGSEVTVALSELLHGYLTGLQGGTGTVPNEEYYHLTSAQHTVATQAATDALNGYMTSTYAAKLDGIAGSANNYVHPNHSGDVSSSGDGAQTIGNNKVTNAMLATVATATIKGRKTAGTGNVEDLSVSDVLTLLNIAAEIRSLLGMTYMKFTGTTSSEKTMTVPDASAVILTNQRNEVAGFTEKTFLVGDDLIPIEDSASDPTNQKKKFKWSNLRSGVKNYGICTTAYGTAAKEVTIEGYTPADGDIIVVTFSNGFSASSPTLSINGGSALPIYINGSTDINTSYISTASSITLAFLYMNATLQISGNQRIEDTYRFYINYPIVAGVDVTKYKVVMEGADGKAYPLTIGDTTELTKEVSTVEFKLRGLLGQQPSTSTISANSPLSIRNQWIIGSAVQMSYAFNQNSGFTANQPVYLKGTINANGNFVLDNTSYTSFLTQTLPSSDDGFVYIYLGAAYNTTQIELIPNHPAYYYKDGRIREYVDDSISAKIHAATVKESIVDNDELGLVDSEASNIIKKTLWSTIKSVLKTYIDAMTSTFTNKRITKRITSITTNATPTINTDNCDYIEITALDTNITSMTTNLSGTPTKGQTLWINIVPTAERSITWGAKFEGDLLPAAVDERTDIGFIWNDITEKWRCVAIYP